MTPRNTYPIEIAGLKRELPLFEVQSGIRIAVLNILGDTELVQASAQALMEKLSAVNYDLIVTAEAKSIPLAYAMSVITQKPYIILRKKYRSYMGETIQVETVSITTGHPQQLYLDEKDRSLLKGKQALLIDDVISTGSTLEGMRNIVKKAGAKVAAEAAILTEGDAEQWKHIYSLGHLPIFKD